MRASLVVLLLLGPIALGRADSNNTSQEAREHYEHANAYYGLGNYPKAAEEFEKAFELKHDPALLYNAAQSQRLAGNKPRALLLYQNLLRVYSSRITNAAEISRHISELEKAIAGDESSRASPPVAPLPVGKEIVPAPASPPPPVETTAPEPAAVVVAAPPPPRPLVKRGWFWGTVVGVVVVAGAAVALGVTLGAPGSHDPRPSLGQLQAN